MCHRHSCLCFGFQRIAGRLSFRSVDVFLVPEGFPTIGAAVEAISNPTTIVIAPGDYAESVSIVGRQYVVLQSARLSRRGVTISGSGGDAVLSIEGSVVHLSGIEIRSNGQRRGIAVIGESISLQECVIAGNRSATPGAAMNCRDAKVRIQKSMLAGNTVDSDSAPLTGGGALYLRNCEVEIAGASIQANAVYATNEARGGGIWTDGGRMRMWRSRVTENALHAPSTHGGGIYFARSEGAQLGGSVITGNNSGSGGGIAIDGNPVRVVIHANTVVRQNHPDDVDVIG
jgi:hypothetical protein